MPKFETDVKDLTPNTSVGGDDDGVEIDLNEDNTSKQTSDTIDYSKVLDETGVPIKNRMAEIERKQALIDRAKAQAQQQLETPSNMEKQLSPEEIKKYREEMAQELGYIDENGEVDMRRFNQSVELMNRVIAVQLQPKDREIAELKAKIDDISFGVENSGYSNKTKELDDYIANDDLLRGLKISKSEKRKLAMKMMGEPAVETMSVIPKHNDVRLVNRPNINSTVSTDRASTKVKLSQSELNFCKQAGIDPKEWARNKVE